MDIKCENCKFFKKLKHNFKVGVGYESSYCCDVLIKMAEDNEVGWIQEVEKDSYCELFDKKSE